MCKSSFVLLFSFALATTAAAQQQPGTAVSLSVDDAVKMALDKNLDLAADRLDPQISDTRVAAAAGAFKPSLTSSFQRNSQLQPPTNFLIPQSTQTDADTGSAGITQRLPKFGTSYTLAWNAVRTNSNSVLNRYNPLVQSGFTLKVSQPLPTDRTTDASRTQDTTTR